MHDYGNVFKCVIQKFFFRFLKSARKACEDNIIRLELFRIFGITLILYMAYAETYQQVKDNVISRRKRKFKSFGRKSFSPSGKDIINCLHFKSF